MSTSAPTPLPATTSSATPEAAAAADSMHDAQALATDQGALADSSSQAPGAAAHRLALHAGTLLSRPAYAAGLLALLTYATVHFLGSRYPSSRLKLMAAAAFAALVYGAGALRDKDPAVALKGLRIIANDATATSGLTITRRLLAAWYVTFPAIALAAACVKRLSPTAMVAVSGGLMLLPALLKTQGVAV